LKWVGFVEMETMGKPMAKNLMKGGYSLLGREGRG